MYFLLMFSLLWSWFVIQKGQDQNVENRQADEERLRLFINGSSKASIEHAPYVAALVIRYSDNTSDPSHDPQLICTGAIIHQYWVISAAHCSKKFPEPLAFRVIAGCDRAEFLYGDDWDSHLPGKQVRKPKDWKLHDHYGPRPGIHPEVPNSFDVMLVNMEEPFEYGQTVRKIPFWARPWRGYKVRLEEGEIEAYQSTCTVYGWGDTEPNKATSELRNAFVGVMYGIEACKCMPSSESLHMLCTSDDLADASAVCPGDGGGPLVCDYKGDPQLAGISYAMYRCREADNVIIRPTPQCGDKLVSSWIYTCPMLQWIHGVVPGVPRLPSKCGRSSSSRHPSNLVADFLLSQLIISFLETLHAGSTAID